MGTNTYKSKRGRSNGKESIFSWIQQSTQLDDLLMEGIPLKYIPQILFITALTVFYIGNNHYAEKTTRKIEKLETEVEELRADYTSLKADYMYSSKQSEVAERVRDLGLEENDVPPVKIIVREDEH